MSKNVTNQKAIIIGASSGIGKELAIEMSKRGFKLGLTARRTNLLEELSKLCVNDTYIEYMDAAQHDESRAILANHRSHGRSRYYCLQCGHRRIEWKWKKRIKCTK